jgi:hypothetical protein
MVESDSQIEDTAMMQDYIFLPVIQYDFKTAADLGEEQASSSLNGF